MLNNQKSFTLVELLVVTGIIVLLSVIIFPNYRVGERQFALERSAHKLAQDIRRAEEMTMSAKLFSCPTGNLQGYGISFTFSPGTDYRLFAQCDSTKPPLETINFEKGVKIQDLAYFKDGSWSGGKIALWFYFVPPDPTVSIKDGAEKARITIALETDITKTKIITINNVGLIDVE